MYRSGRGRSRLNMKLAPNPRLHRTRAAVLLQSVRGGNASLDAAGRAPVSRKPLGSR